MMLKTRINTTHTFINRHMPAAGLGFFCALFVCMGLVSGCAEKPTRVVVKSFSAQAQARALPKRAGYAELDCASLTPNQAVTITQPTQLVGACQLRGVTFYLTQTGAALDCRGAHLAGDTKASAISIVSDQPIKNIRVENCHVTGYGHALHVHQSTPPRVRYLASKNTGSSIDPEVLRAKAPQHISIGNLTSVNSKNSAVFIGNHVHHVTMDGLNIQNAGTAGVYFEFGSQHNVVKNSRFTGGGHRSFKPDREAIAIDSSSHNRIENNHFEGNGAGAIFLYRNCFEHAEDTTRGNHFLRTESSDNNVIAGNTIKNEAVGVWVASRQSRNLKGFRCGAYALKSTPFASYHEDAAEHNRIAQNRFEHVDKPVVVEDDNNVVTANLFVQTGRPAVTVGSTVRAETRLGSVRGNSVVDNRVYDNCKSQNSCQIGDFFRAVGGSQISQQNNALSSSEPSPATN